MEKKKESILDEMAIGNPKNSPLASCYIAFSSPEDADREHDFWIYNLFLYCFCTILKKKRQPWFVSSFEQTIKLFYFIRTAKSSTLCTFRANIRKKGKNREKERGGERERGREGEGDSISISHFHYFFFFLFFLFFFRAIYCAIALSNFYFLKNGKSFWKESFMLCVGTNSENVVKSFFFFFFFFLNFFLFFFFFSSSFVSGILSHTFKGGLDILRGNCFGLIDVKKGGRGGVVWKGPRENRHTEKDSERDFLSWPFTPLILSHKINSLVYKLTSSIQMYFWLSVFFVFSLFFFYFIFFIVHYLTIFLLFFFFLFFFPFL